MSLEERVEDQEEVQRYLQKKNIHQIMHEIVEELLIHQPDDPISYLLSYLKQSDRKIIFLIGPPGLHLYSIVQKAIGQKIKVTYCAFNSGQYMMKNKDTLPQNALQKLTVSRMIDDDGTNEKLISQITRFCGSNSHSLIEGFPKSLKQALKIHQKGICPDKVIFVNVERNLLKSLCKNKIKENSSEINQGQAEKLAENAAQQYLMNLKDLKQYYPSYLQINGGAQIQEQSIHNQIQRCLNLKFGSIQPRKNTRIVIIGAPYSGRTTLSNKIAKKYNLIHVSTAELISEEIRRGTVTGRKLKEMFLSRQMIDNFQVEKLIEERISKKDCQMQGFVLQGYPKNKQQWENMQNLHIYPNFIIGIHPPKQLLLQRKSVGQNPDFSDRYDRWSRLYEEQLKSKEQIFWATGDLNADNCFEEVCFEIENHKV